ncbi:AAA family ATPase [Cupriavidus respiraculi]|uniref:AAA family ATPase n=1 Tax=Cupriavidus respiraculi TaxID=195930 RepID=UPI001C98255F|nr:AAA family ATPase [Cupriavidus respiraculi]MBY4946227.1 AAA family ATPase [Cupriavidus respiraculi]
MRILAIRGRNLASLAGEFEVDFTREPLASAGLYAIGGPTGAGKSTLLDALCLALYDETPRVARVGPRGAGLPDVGEETVGAHDPRTLLRRGCAEGYAEVDFVGGDALSYRARWSVRRARARASGKLQETQMALSVLQADAGTQPVGSALKTEVKAAIVQRIGLTFEQFTRAVLLAQNEFFAFLKAGDDDRAALLQALTGTDRFEAISRRAFERNKAEQDTLRGLSEAAAAHQPFDADTRAHWEAQRAERQRTGDALQARCRQLEDHLRWHTAHQQAVRAQAEAQQGCAAALARRDGAEDRRRHLAAVEAAQSARPLLEAADRLEGEAQRALALAEQAGAALATAAATAAHARALEADAAARRDAARATQAALAPAVAKAREFDAALTALAPEHARAVRTRDEATASLAQARHASDGSTQAHREAVAEHAAAARWLASHMHLDALARQWQRCDTLLAQAADLLTHQRQAESTGADVVRALARSREAAGAAQAAADRAATGLREAEAALAGLQREQAACDADALAARKQAADRRREALQTAGALWREWLAAGAHSAELDGRHADHEAKLAACRAQLDEANARRPQALAAEQQAERSWRLAYAACQQSVEALRDGLQPDAPCPVCGATDHPYAHTGEPLRDALNQALHSLESEHRARQAELATLTAAIATQGALVASHTQAVEALAQQRALARRRLEAAEHAWSLHAGATELDGIAGIADAQRLAWLDERLAQAEAQQQAAGAQEAAWRELQRRAHAARADVDAARAQQARASDALRALQSETDALVLRQQHAEATAAQQRERLAGVLAELDAGGLGAACGPSWHEAWQRDPAGYRAARRAEIEAVLKAEADAQALRQRIDRLAAALTAAAEALERAGIAHRDAAQSFAEAEAGRVARQRERDALFAGTPYAGRPVRDIETALEQAVADAQAALEAAQVRCRHAAHDEARAAETDRQARERLVAVQSEAADARARVAAWLAAHRERRATAAMTDGSSDEAGLAADDNGGLQRLRQWLAHGADWQAAEREALHGLDRAVAEARAVAAERNAKREQIEATCPGPESAEAVRGLLDAALAAHADAKQAIAEAEFALRRDDERRAAASDAVARIAAQQERARVWARLNELIGSADGRKFRNYAQQLTLDILLGYANRHLATLSRRYRLERVRGSLALLVVDQDMADEMRSVHSLSGGESFLVSLALALGLASLSSHRVRVESLFIDEGFGSLDADTLRVAMDALDSLQAQGRKVGVISHVQEMTERIGTRIEIRRLAGGQSRLVIEGAPG